MHTSTILHKRLRKALPSIHSVRLNALIAAIESLTLGLYACVSSLGRGLAGEAYPKHKIKRIDRLLSNPQLYQDRVSGKVLTHLDTSGSE